MQQLHKILLLSVFLMISGFLIPASLHAQLAGTYTIDASQPTNGSNYSSFFAAATDLTIYGVSGQVVFNVSPGIYTEQITIPAIAGASAQNTIIFNGHGASLTFNPINPLDRGVIKLDGANYVVIDSLNIEATGSTITEYGYGIHLLNGACNNRITNSTVTLNKSTSGTIAANYACIVINSSASGTNEPGLSRCNDNLIENNTLIGGYYGVIIAGDTLSNPNYGNVIRNNIIQDFYRTGIFLTGTESTIVEGNDVSRPARPGTSFFQYFGLNMDYKNQNCIVCGNKFHDPFGTFVSASSSAYALYIYKCSPTPGKENIFYNNLIYNLNSAGITVGVELALSNYNKFYHNTISLDDINAPSNTFGMTRGFDMTSTNITLINNLVSVTRTGSTFAAKHCVYINSLTGQDFQNNNYYFNTTGTSGVGYYSGNRINLSAWQLATSLDVNSFSLPPQFNNPSLGDFSVTNNSLQAGVDTTVTLVGRDIVGNMRDAGLPTIGAYEIISPLSLQLITFTGTLTAGKAHLSWVTHKEANNNGFWVQRSLNGSFWTDVQFIKSKTSAENAAVLTYALVDDQPVSQATYYRLAYESLDGNINYSHVVTLQPSNSAMVSEFTIYPNPARDVITISFSAEAQQGAIIDLTGRTLWTGTIYKRQQINVKDLPAGIYEVIINNKKQLLMKE